MIEYKVGDLLDTECEMCGYYDDCKLIIVNDKKVWVCIDCEKNVKCEST